MFCCMKWCNSQSINWTLYDRICLILTANPAPHCISYCESCHGPSELRLRSLKASALLLALLWLCLAWQDDITGDGTTSNVLIIGELLKQADLYISEVSFCD